MKSTTWRLAHNSGHFEPIGFWIGLSVLAVACAAFGLGSDTPDVAWMIDVCARIYHGEIPYIDIFETNPPVAILIYMPGVLVEQWTGLDAALGVSGQIAFLYLIILAFTAHILPAHIVGIGSTRWAILTPAAFFLFVLSSDAFAQRETIAAALTLPMTAVFIRHTKDRTWPSSGVRLGAALLGGLAMAIKPPLFALPFIVLGVFYLLFTRMYRGLLSSGLVVSFLIGVAITIASLALYPAYLGEMTTLMRDVYVPLFRSFKAAKITAIIGVFFCFLPGLLYCLRKTPTRATLLLYVVALAYAATFLVQGKYFPYHAAPLAMFALMSAGSIAWPHMQELRKSFGINRPSLEGMISALAVVIACQNFWDGFDDKRFIMKDIAWAEDLNKPTAMAISTDVSISFPLARQIDARWVDRIHAQWIALYTRIQLGDETRSTGQTALLQDYHAKDIERTLALIRAKNPEILIHCIAPASLWLTEEMLQVEPDLFDDYVIIAEEGPTRIWRRRDAIKRDAVRRDAVKGASMAQHR